MLHPAPKRMSVGQRPWKIDELPSTMAKWCRLPRKHTSQAWLPCIARSRSWRVLSLNRLDTSRARVQERWLSYYSMIVCENRLLWCRECNFRNNYKMIIKNRNSLERLSMRVSKVKKVLNRNQGSYWGKVLNCRLHQRMVICSNRGQIKIIKKVQQLSASKLSKD